MEMATIYIGSNYGPVQEVDPDGDDGDNGNKFSLIGYYHLDFMKAKRCLVLIWSPMIFLLVNC
jgi:hypothetical protein